MNKILLALALVAVILTSGCLCCCCGGGSPKSGWDSYDDDYWDYGAQVDEIDATGPSKTPIK